MTGTREDTAAAQAEMEAHKIIKAMRLYLGMTQEELARKAGISPGLYFRYEKVPGYVLRGKFSEVCKVLKLLRLDPRKFYRGKYILNEAGYKAIVPRRGRLNFVLQRGLRQSCPVSCEKTDEKGGKHNGRTQDH